MVVPPHLLHGMPLGNLTDFRGLPLILQGAPLRDALVFHTIVLAPLAPPLGAARASGLSSWWCLLARLTHWLISRHGWTRGRPRERFIPGVALLA